MEWKYFRIIHVPERAGAGTWRNRSAVGEKPTQVPGAAAGSQRITGQRDIRREQELQGTRRAMEVAEPAFRRTVLDDPQGFQTMCDTRWAETAFIVVDNSNIFINAQYIDGERDLSVRVSIPKLLDVVRHGRHPITQMVAGSKNGVGDPRWKHAYENEHVVVHLEDRRGGDEQAVDDLIHAQALQTLNTVDFGKGPRSQTLILLTGDGNDNGGRTRFPDIVIAAMRHNTTRQIDGRDPLWKVEIVSWNRSLSGELKRLRDLYPEYIFIRLLDQHRDYVTFQDRRYMLPTAAVGRGRGAAAAAGGRGGSSSPRISPRAGIPPSTGGGILAAGFHGTAAAAAASAAASVATSSPQIPPRTPPRAASPASSGGVYTAAQLAAVMDMKRWGMARGGSFRVCELGQPVPAGSPQSFYMQYPHHKTIVQEMRPKHFCAAVPMHLRFETAPEAGNHMIVIIQAGSTSTPVPVPVSVHLETECIICMDEDRNMDIAFWPCRHRHFCRTCADRLVGQRCPICRVTVDEVLQLF